MRLIYLLLFAALIALVVSKGKKSHAKTKKAGRIKNLKKKLKSMKRNLIGGGISYGDPYGSIGAALPPVSGVPVQAGVSEDDVIPASSEFGANSRYNIPDELSYTHQAVKHSGDHLSLDSHPIHLSAHPIPFPGHTRTFGGRSHFEQLCHEGYENYCYSPYNGFNEYSDLGMHIGHNFGLTHGVHTHHVNTYNHAPTWRGDLHYSLDAYPNYVGNVLSNDQALKLGFDTSYLKKLGYDGRSWHHGHDYATTHVYHGGLGHLGGLIGHGVHGHGIHGLGQCRLPMDIAFLVDGSTDKGNFEKFIDFIQAVIRKYPISESGTRVALLTFAEKGQLTFGFDRYLNTLQILRALKDIKDKYQKKDGRKLGDGLKIAKTDLFDVSGRDEKHKVLFILTDGAAGDTFNEQAQALKDSAVSIYAVGPKANLKTEQIKAVVSDKDEWFSYITEDYDEMIKKVAPRVPTVSCNVDIVFVIDCTKGDKTKLDEIKAFIRHSVSGLAIGTRGDHVGVVTYGGKADIKFNLNKKSHIGQFQAALQEVECGKGGAADGAPAIGLVRDVFDKSGHMGALNVTVYISGSKTASNVAEPARLLRNMGIRFYAAGYGKEANEDDLKKIASLPSDYFVHVKDDERKMAAIVGRTMANHLRDLKGGIAGGIGGFGIHGAYGVGGFGSWTSPYLRSGIDNADEISDIQNIQDDTSKVLKDLSSHDENQDGFSTSFSERNPELSYRNSASELSEVDNREIDESLEQGNGMDRGTIENEALSKPYFDAEHGDSLTESSQLKKHTVHGKHPSKKDNEVASRDSVENSTATADNSTASGESQSKVETSTESKEKKDEASTENQNKKDETSTETKDKKDETSAENKESKSDTSTANADVSSTDNTQNSTTTDASSAQASNSTNGNGTITVRGKFDPYSSIGTDMSSDEGASNMKLNINKDSGSEGKTMEQKKTNIHESVKESPKDSTKESPKDSAGDVHTDIISTAHAYDGSNKRAEIKEGEAVKKHMTKQEKEMLKSPVHSLVKSIFHKAAKSALLDFTKSSGLKNVAKLLVHAAVHNAMLKRPAYLKAFKTKQESKKKLKKGKKKHENAEVRSPKAAKKENPKDDLMEIGRDKVEKNADKPVDEFEDVKMESDTEKKGLN